MQTLRKLRAKISKWMEGGPRRQPTPWARLAVEALERRDLMSANPIALGNWVNLNGGVLSISTARDANGNLDVFAIGTDHAMYYKSQSPNGSWSGWAPLGGWVRSSISAIQDAAGNMDVFSIGLDGSVVYRSQTPSGWTGWNYLGGGVLSLSTALDARGNLDVFAVGTDHAVYYRSQSSMGIWWNGWTGLGGWVSSISTILPSGSNLEVFGIGGDQGVWYQSQNVYNYAWSGWNSLGGPAYAFGAGQVTSMSTSLDAQGNVDVFASCYLNYGFFGGAQQPAYYRSQTAGGAWSGWNGLGGGVTAVSAMRDDGGNLGVFAIGTDQQVYYQVQSPYGYWSGWMPLSGKATSISAVSDTGGNLGVVAIGTDQRVSCRERAAYSPIYGSLFGPYGPSYTDVQQGAIGDCWLLAGLAEVAVRAPSDITSMFSYAGTSVVNGSVVNNYTVRLYDNVGVPRYYTVDTELPAGGGLYDQPRYGVLWVALAEKAYVEANGDGSVTSGHRGFNYYDALNNGGTEWALQAITGNPAGGQAFGSSTDIATAWQQGQLITLVTQDSATPLSVNGVNVAGNHEYAVVGYFAATQQFVLFNPWGANGGTDPTTGVFCPATVVGTTQQLAAAFTSDAIGSGAAPAERKDRHTRPSQGPADLAFLADVLEPHAKHRRFGEASVPATVSAN
jgi:hypothetical protein